MIKAKIKSQPAGNDTPAGCFGFTDLRQAWAIPYSAIPASSKISSISTGAPLATDISAAGGPIRWMDLGEDEDIYLARVKWLPDGDLSAQVQNRAQDELRLLRLDPQTGASRVLLTETNAVWINLHRLFRPLKAGGFLWGSERDGFMHLYRYDAEGALVRQLTSGAWMVEAVKGLDEDAGKVYFTGTPAAIHYGTTCSRVRIISLSFHSLKTRGPLTSRSSFLTLMI